jgi:RsiW-degrading membrane proteinase PrsW (M82 family)
LRLCWNIVLLARNVLLVVLPALAVALWANHGVLDLRRSAAALGLGGLSAIVALIAGLIIPPGVRSGTGFGGILVRSFLVVAATEELSRLLVMPLAVRRTTSQSARAGLRLGVLVGTGFAILESFTVLGRSSSVLALRSVTALPLHAFGGAALGYALGVVRSEGPERSAVFTIAAAALLVVGVHGSYQLLLILGSPFDLGAIGIVVLITLAVVIADQRLKDTGPHGEHFGT